MIEFRLKSLKKKFNSLGIDGYVVAQNDEFSSEYSHPTPLTSINSKHRDLFPPNHNSWI